jgi:putative hydrolase of the HAD superfamily
VRPCTGRGISLALAVASGLNGNLPLQGLQAIDTAIMPIRNVIFDLGGVLIEWNPERILARRYSNQNCQRLVNEALFRHEDWLAFDRGVLAENELLERVHARTGRSLQELTGVLAAMRDSLVEKPATVAVLRSLHNRGVSLYCLSTMPATVFDHVRQRHSFWNVFKGIVISGVARLAKPDRAVFEHLLLRCNIAAAKTVFVDDLPANIDGARAVGLDAILFSDAAQCQRELETRLRHFPLPA